MEKLNEQEKNALLDALDDEYKSWTTYDQVIRNFGKIRPFINVREAEGRHIEALLKLCQHYGVTPPPNRWLNNTPQYNNLIEACRAGVVGEIDNVALYDRISKSTIRQDILNVYDALRRASQERHLPAFQRCAERGN